MKGFVCGAVAGIALMGATQYVDLSPATARAAAPDNGVTDARRCSRAQEAANKQVILNLGMPTPDSLYAAMHPDYIQHNPDAARFMEINGVKGRAGMGLLREAFDKLNIRYGPPPGMGAGAPPPPNMHYKILAECDTVVVVAQLKMPDPTQPGKFYDAYGFDMYRIKDGKLYEHWDAMRINNPPPPYLAGPLKDLKPAPMPPAPGQ